MEIESVKIVKNPLTKIIQNTDYIFRVCGNMETDLFKEKDKTTGVEVEKKSDVINVEFLQVDGVDSVGSRTERIPVNFVMKQAFETYGKALIGKCFRLNIKPKPSGKKSSPTYLEEVKVTNKK